MGSVLPQGGGRWLWDVTGRDRPILRAHQLTGRASLRLFETRLAVTIVL